MKKFTNLTDKSTSVKTKGNIDKVNADIISQIDGTKLDGSWEIESIIDICSESTDINESKSLIINAEVGNREIKRGEFIYITAQIKRTNQTTAYHQSQMGVIKVRVVDIYNSMFVLNNL